MIVHGEVEDLPATLHEAHGSLHKILTAIPVGVLECVVQDEEARLPFHGDRSESHPQGKEGLLADPGAHGSQRIVLILVRDEDQTLVIIQADALDVTP